MVGKGDVDQEFADFEQRRAEEPHPGLPCLLTEQARGCDEDVQAEVEQYSQSRQAMKRVEVSLKAPSAAAEPSEYADFVGVFFMFHYKTTLNLVKMQNR